MTLGTSRRPVSLVVSNRDWRLRGHPRIVFDIVEPAEGRPRGGGGRRSTEAREVAPEWVVAEWEAREVAEWEAVGWEAVGWEAVEWEAAVEAVGWEAAVEAVGWGTWAFSFQSAWAARPRNNQRGVALCGPVVADTPFRYLTFAPSSFVTH